MADDNRHRLSEEFWDLQDKQEAVRKKSAPLRKKYDDLNNKMMEELRELAAEIKAVEEPLRAMGNRPRELAQSLGNKIEPRKK